MNPERKRVLIVEDEQAIRTGLLDVFVYHGYEVEGAENGNDGLRLALSGQFDLILLDVMLPGMDGFEICNRIRQEDKEQPVIMLTAKTAETDIIQGLKLGADDYVSKPFSVAELVLRAGAVLRRATPEQPRDKTLTLSGDITVDTRNLTGSTPGRELVFTRREMEVLRYLAEHAERPVPRDELLHKVWGYGRDLDIETRTVDIHIAKLRRKIEPDPKEPVNLITVRGAGYRLILTHHE